MSNPGLFTLLFTGTWCLVGAVFLAIGVGMRRSWARREERLRARAAGRVVEVVRRTGHGSDGRATVSFYPIVEFEADGQTVSLESSQSGGRKTHYEGQVVEVLYDPDDPSRFRLEGENGQRTMGAIFLAVGLGCIAVGLIAALAARGVGRRTFRDLPFDLSEFSDL